MEVIQKTKRRQHCYAWCTLPFDFPLIHPCSFAIFPVALYKQPADLPPCYGIRLSWCTGTDPGALTRPVTQTGREWNNLSSGECKSQPKDTAEVLVGEGVCVCVGGGVKPLIVSPSWQAQAGEGGRREGEGRTVKQGRRGVCAGGYLSSDGAIDILFPWLLITWSAGSCLGHLAQTWGKSKSFGDPPTLHTVLLPLEELPSLCPLEAMRRGGVNAPTELWS